MGTVGEHVADEPCADPAARELPEHLGPCAGAGEDAGKHDECPNLRWRQAHGLGRNTRRAASDPSNPARAATNSRSNSGTNSEVRAPECVGMCASGW